MPPSAMWRRSRSFSPKSMERRPSGRRTSGGTGNTPRRSSGVSLALFIVKPSEDLSFAQRVVRCQVRPAPRPARRPVDRRVGPERIAGGEAEGQEGGGAEVEAAGADVGLGDARLVAAEADPQPALVVEG